MREEHPHMNKKRGMLVMGCALLLMTLIFKPGYRIIIDDTPLSGVYEPETALRCAEKVREQDEQLPLRLIPVLCREYTDTNTARLCSRLLSYGSTAVQVSATTADNSPNP